MEKHKEVFFVIRLHSAQSAASLAVSVQPQKFISLVLYNNYSILTQPIQDPDPLLTCDLMDGRDAFLTLARDKHYEFSSLRRAQFSTLSMLYELHNQGQDKFVYTCNNCKTAVETRYHCTVCDVRPTSKIFVITSIMFFATFQIELITTFFNYLIFVYF